MRIIGVNIPDAKRIEIALTYVFGIGKKKSQDVLTAAKIDLNKRAKDITPEELNRIKEQIDKTLTVEGNLRREISQNIKRKKEIGLYQGIRHTRGLPARGQKTKTNSRTVRGNVRRTMGSGRKPTAGKT